MKRAHKVLLVLVLSGTSELIFGVCMRFLSFAGANLILGLGLLSQVSALGYASYLSLKDSKVSMQ